MRLPQQSVLPALPKNVGEALERSTGNYGEGATPVSQEHGKVVGVGSYNDQICFSVVVEVSRFDCRGPESVSRTIASTG